MSDAGESSKVRQEALQTARRVVVDGDLWLVYELPPFPFDRRNTPSLVFESELAVRRIRDYPADWRSFSDEALLALSWRRPVPW